MRGRVAALLLVLVLAADAAPARAGEIARELLTGRVIVTGREDPAERARGFREGLAEVLVKVSGDARLLDDGRLEPLLPRAADFLAGFTYADRHGRKINHEQGTRDRSYWLETRFSEAAIRQALAEIGARPWLGERPKLLVLLGIDDSLRRYVVSGTSARGIGQREALLAIAARRALPVTLPEEGAVPDPALLASAARGPDRAADAAIAALAREAGAGAVLCGFMRLGPEGYWNTDWISRHGETARERGFRSPRATFDRAIGEGLAGAARVMAGIE
ncbi:MAG: DUF2066 domain-containing protein [Alphaproteobacteria bacterium]|nr:DUF2066 domain-containing protein [Alphaproteobacteria bacterium]